MGKTLGISKENAVRWIKKPNNFPSEVEPVELLELDEMYWFMDKKPRTQTRENTSIITMVS